MTMENDAPRPYFLDSFLNLKGMTLSHVQDFKRKPVFTDSERLVCLLQGRETFRMVSSIFKQNMYSGVFMDMDPLETPINLFETDMEKIQKYKLMKIDDVYQANMEAGSCLFIPSYYWYQSRTVGESALSQLNGVELSNYDGMSAFITFEYESHSVLVNELIQALDKGLVEDN